MTSQKEAGQGNVNKTYAASSLSPNDEVLYLNFLLTFYVMWRYGMQEINLNLSHKPTLSFRSSIKLWVSKYIMLYNIILYNFCVTLSLNFSCVSFTFPLPSLVKGNNQEAMGLHFAMFTPTLYSQCDPQQSRKWLPLANSYQVVGTYAQTELGHGQSWT